MKLPATQTRVNTEDSLGLGIEGAVIIAMFLGIGYGLDRLFGRYDDRMDEHEAERLARQARSGGRNP